MTTRQARTILFQINGNPKADELRNELFDVQDQDAVITDLTVLRKFQSILVTELALTNPALWQIATELEK